jgi:cytosine/adenosine deaminase-related metal-dependent hydrolase
MADDDRNAQFLAALANLGGSAGNGRLRETLRWDEPTYATVQSALVASCAIVSGRGRGGYSADREVIATGKAVAPGFIDAHTHDDRAVLCGSACI